VFVYGWAKITGGAGTWADLGGNMAIFGIEFFPTFWGFMAALTEFAGGLLLILGLLFRPVLALLLVTMSVAAASHLVEGEGPWHATEMETVFVTLFLLGPGRYSLDAWLFGEPETDTVDEQPLQSA
jgi:putative oxidoreductase